MGLSRSEFDAIKHRAEELVYTGSTPFPPEKYPPEQEPLVELLAQLKRDNTRLVEEVERLWRNHPPDE
jgi:hypothetical protein